MKKLLALTLATLCLSPAFAQTSVGVSIGINQPGMYGRIDLGNHPPPQVILPQPVVIMPSPVARHQQPIYLYVPPGHQKKWDKHCYRYNACGQPVYFVQESWVKERYEERRDHDGRGRRGHDARGDRDRDHDRDDDKRNKRRDNDRDDDRGDNQRGGGNTRPGDMGRR